MPAVDKLYSWLAQEPTPSAERILASALPLAEDAHFQRIVDILLARQNDASWAGLISQFSRLSAEQQDIVLLETKLVRAGIAAAARWHAAEARENAFRVLNLKPTEKLAFLIPAALRDSSQTVRKLAISALRAMADSFLQRHVAPLRGVRWSDTVEPETHLFLEVMHQVFQKFSFHLQVEAFEVTLWFARYFEAEIWESLDAPRSHTAFVAREQLAHWRSPHLTGFLLLCLERREWRRIASARLEKFASREECQSLLIHSELLQSPEIAHAVSLIRKPAWYEAFLANWDRFSAAQQDRIPQWLALSAIDRESNKIELLAKLAETKTEAIRADAILALAELSSREAERALARIAATGNDAMAHFASWLIQGRLLSHAETESQERQSIDRRTRMARFCDAPPNAHQLSSMWQMLQRGAMDPDFDAARIVSADLEMWGNEVGRRLQAADARERMMAVRFAQASGLATHLVAQIQPLLNDRAPGVRAAAMEVLHVEFFGKGQESAGWEQ
ncbi:MAG: hypothetical protein AB7N71_04520 [Phycisphaerae bacterium]